MVRVELLLAALLGTWATTAHADPTYRLRTTSPACMSADDERGLLAAPASEAGSLYAVLHAAGRCDMLPGGRLVRLGEAVSGQPELIEAGNPDQCLCRYKVFVPWDVVDMTPVPDNLATQ